jgi:hypothetical protein
VVVTWVKERGGKITGGWGIRGQDLINPWLGEWMGFIPPSVYHLSFPSLTLCTNPLAVVVPGCPITGSRC